MVLRALTVCFALYKVPSAHLSFVSSTNPVFLRDKRGQLCTSLILPLPQPDQLVVDRKKFTIFHFLVTEELLKANNYFTFHLYVDTIY